MAATIQMEALTTVQTSQPDPATGQHVRKVYSKGTIFFATPEDAEMLERLGGARPSPGAATTGVMPESRKAKPKPVQAPEPEVEPATASEQTFVDEPEVEAEPEPEPAKPAKAKRGKRSKGEADDLV